MSIVLPAWLMQASSSAGARCSQPAPAACLSVGSGFPLWSRRAALAIHCPQLVWPRARRKQGSYSRSHTSSPAPQTSHRFPRSGPDALPWTVAGLAVWPARVPLCFQSRATAATRPCTKDHVFTGLAWCVSLCLSVVPAVRARGGVCVCVCVCLCGLCVCVCVCVCLRLPALCTHAPALFLALTVGPPCCVSTAACGTAERGPQHADAARVS